MLFLLFSENNHLKLIAVPAASFKNWFGFDLVCFTQYALHTSSLRQFIWENEAVNHIFIFLPGTVSFLPSLVDELLIVQRQLGSIWLNVCLAIRGGHWCFRKLMSPGMKMILFVALQPCMCVCVCVNNTVWLLGEHMYKSA